MSVLVLCEDADDYKDLLTTPEDISFATTLAHTSTDANTYEILLAQPDFAADYLNQGKTARWVQSTWAGITPLAAVASKRDVLVTGVKGVFGPLITEYVLAYLLDDIRDLNRLATAQSQRTWQPYYPDTLQGRHLVIAGTGSIGAHVAQVARSFGMRVSGISRSGETKPGFDKVWPTSGLVEAVSDADYFLLTLPETIETRNIIDATVLNALPQHCMLLNVGRGQTIDTAAFISAIEENRIRRAVLDVFTDEPLTHDSPFWDLPNTLITPHVAAVSYPKDIAKIFLNNLDRYQNGMPLDYVMDLERGY